MKKTIVIFILLVCLSSDSFAALRLWHTAEISEPYGIMTMVRNATWPVVATSSSVSFLGPNGFTQSTASGSFARQIVSGPNGQIAVVTENNIKLFKNNRWNTIIVPGRQYSSVAFDNQGSLHAATGTPEQNIYYAAFTGTSWALQNTDVILPPGSNVLKFTMDSYNVPSFVTVSTFASKSSPYGTWETNTVGPTVRGLAISPSDLPGIVQLSGSQMKFITYSPQLQDWTSEIVDSGVFNSMTVGFDNLGNPAMAYGRNGSIFFAINDGTGSGWEICDLGAFTAARSTLAFDADNNPVACFSNDTTTIVKYDPIVPEPASVLLIVSTLAMVIRKNRHAQ